LIFGDEDMEKGLYKPIWEAIAKLLTSTFPRKGVHLEITADKNFSNTLKSRIPDFLDIVLPFLKDVKPDITGYIKQNGWVDIIVIEVKDEPIKLDHIYQVKKYAELLRAKYALLISTCEIPEEIKRLCKKLYAVLSLPGYNKITLVHYEKEKNQFREWFEEIPFKEG
jgi:hypothetical protein